MNKKTYISPAVETDGMDIRSELLADSFTLSVSDEYEVSDEGGQWARQDSDASVWDD